METHIFGSQIIQTECGKDIESKLWERLTCGVQILIKLFSQRTLRQYLTDRIPQCTVGWEKAP